MYSLYISINRNETTINVSYRYLDNFAVHRFHLDNPLLRYKYQLQSSISDQVDHRRQQIFRICEGQHFQRGKLLIDFNFK